MDLKYPSIDEIYKIHDRMIKIGGGRAGIRDFTLLHSATERPKATFYGKLLYPSIWLQAAALMHSLVKNHPFEDGNKRTGYFSTMYFLRLNNYQVNAERKELVNFVLSVDTQNLSLEVMAHWLKEHSKKIK